MWAFTIAQRWRILSSLWAEAQICCRLHFNLHPPVHFRLSCKRVGSLFPHGTCVYISQKFTLVPSQILFICSCILLMYSQRYNTSVAAYVGRPSDNTSSFALFWFMVNAFISVSCLLEFILHSSKHVKDSWAIIVFNVFFNISCEYMYTEINRRSIKLPSCVTRIYHCLYLGSRGIANSQNWCKLGESVLS